MSGALAFPKPKRQQDSAYLDWIRLQPCLIDRAAAQAHHTVPVGAGGSDYRTLPFCPRHHAELHRIGPRTFEVRYRIDLIEEVLRHLELYLAALREGI